jgi:hypothetical protein
MHYYSYYPVQMCVRSPFASQMTGKDGGKSFVKAFHFSILTITVTSHANGKYTKLSFESW